MFSCSKNAQIFIARTIMYPTLYINGNRCYFIGMPYFAYLLYALPII